MKTTIGNFEIEVFVDQHQGNPSDNPQQYHKIFEDVDDSQYRHINGLGVRSFKNGDLVDAVLVTAHGGGTGLHDKSIIFEEDRLLICCGNFIFCLSIPYLNLLWKTECDMATCFGIYSYKNDYIVHGELEISRLSHDGKIVWQQGGADIFTEVKVNDFINATDFYNGRYQFDFEGKLLSYTEGKR